MTIIHSFEGVGALIVQGERHADVRYRVDIARVSRNHLVARGSLTMAAAKAIARGALMMAFNDGAATLELDSGETVQIVPSRYVVGNEPPGIMFVVNGPFPGFGE